MARRLYRSNQHKILGGVCGGLGKHFDVDPTWIRLGFVLLALAKGVGILLYIIGWIIIPRQREDEEAIIVEGESAPAADSTGSSSESSGLSSSLIPGIALIVIGVLFLLRESFWWFDWGVFWPMILIFIGGALLLTALNRRNSEETDEQEVANESS